MTAAGVVRAEGVEREECAPPRADVAARAADDARFGFALQPHLGAAGENLVWSPYGVTHAFALAYAGARGDTREQLGRALRFPDHPGALHPVLNALDRTVAAYAGEEVTIATANAAWGLPEYPWEREFLEVLARHHGAGMRTADFRGDPEAAAAALDAWVREATRDRIRDVFSARDFGELTRLVLANAGYLRAPWSEEFDPEATRERPFAAPGGTVDVATMHTELGARTAAGDGWEAIELPYRDDLLAMLVIVPAAGALEDVERRLAGGLLSEVVDGLAREEVGLALPRFRIESALDLRGPLERLGVRDAFDAGRADFGGMTRAEPLWIAAARQKAFVGVDEHGTEAAAATVVMAMGVAARAPARPFVVDRPFLFAIRQRPTGAVLFSGRVTRP